MPVRGSLLHGYVTAVLKSAEKRLETIKQLAIGACGLQVWKVAQLVEQETIPSSRFDSWLSNSLIWESNTFLSMTCRNTGHFCVL